MAVEESRSLQFTPTWIVAGVCFVIILISLCAERALHRLGKLLKHAGQLALFEALEKLKEELMLLGFISLMLTVFQGSISRICIPPNLVTHMLPCKLSQSAEAPTSEHLHKTTIGRHLLSTETTDLCSPKGKVPLLSLEALHQLHIFIFVLAVVHALFCASTMALGGLQIRQWKRWEQSAKRGKHQKTPSIHREEDQQHREIFKQRASGYWRKAAIVSWTISFCKQFYNSVSKSDYIALRQGFIKAHCPTNYNFDFHKYIMRTLEADFKKVVGISVFLWMFVIVFLLLDVEGWHTYFWLSFLPLILLLLVGAKLEHIITRLAQEAVEDQANEVATVKPSDEHFWFRRPKIVLQIIHFILFQNSFEIAFFFWILCTYGFHSCMMEKYGYIIPRLIMGVLVQVLCSYSTLPLYVLVTQMGSMFKQQIFDDQMQSVLIGWAQDVRDRGGSTNPRSNRSSKSGSSTQSKANMMASKPCYPIQLAEHHAVVDGLDTHGTGNSGLP